MKKLVIGFCFVAGSLFAKPELAVNVEIASFGDISKKVSVLGGLINNPLVPTLILGAGQQQLAQTYGAFRSDSPMYVRLYVDGPEFLKLYTCDNRKCENEEAAAKCFNAVLIYPSAVGVATMALNHPGSSKEDDGTLHILAGSGNPKERWVKFSSDGKYCAIADNADASRMAIADFEKEAGVRSQRANVERPLAFFELTQSALEFVSALNDRSVKDGKCYTEQEEGLQFLQNLMAMQTKLQKSESGGLKKFKKADVVFDLDASGLTIVTRAPVKASVKPPQVAGHSLPPEVFESGADNVFMYFAGLSQVGNAYSFEGKEDFKQLLKDFAKLLREDLVHDIRGCKELKKYSAILEEIAKAAADMMEELEYPAVTDWASVSFAVNNEKIPYVFSEGRSENAEKVSSVSDKFMTRLIENLSKQWPTEPIIAKTSDGYVIDWASAINVGISESGLKMDEGMRKSAENAKATVARILGSTKTEIRTKVDGKKMSGSFATPGLVIPPSRKKIGENIFAALPEAKKDRPATVFYFPIYGFARDVLLPILQKNASAKEKPQFNTLIASMPASEANSALVGSGWIDKNGDVRAILRITPSELKNFGAAFNAFTAAAMLNTSGDDDDL